LTSEATTTAFFMRQGFIQGEGEEKWMHWDSPSPLPTIPLSTKKISTRDVLF